MECFFFFDEYYHTRFPMETGVFGIVGRAESYMHGRGFALASCGIFWEWVHGRTKYAK